MKLFNAGYIPSLKYQSSMGLAQQIRQNRFLLIEL
jgi:hypothetical protein